MSPKPWLDIDVVEHLGFENASHSQRAAYLAALVWRSRRQVDAPGGQDMLGLAQVYATLALEDALDAVPGWDAVDESVER